MSVGGEQARRVCVQVHSWGRLSTGGSADRHCTSSHDTVGPFVNGRQRQQALRQVARTCLQIHVQVCWSMGVNAGKRCARSPGYSCKSASRAACWQEAALVGCERARPNMRAGTQPGPVVNRMQRQWALCQLARHSWGRLSAGGNTGMHCASLTDHVCIYLSRTACRCDATPVRAVPTRTDVRAGTRPGPVSTGGNVCRVEESHSSMCAGTQLGGLSRGGSAGRCGASSPEYACRYMSTAGSRREATQVGTAAVLACGYTAVAQ